MKVLCINAEPMEGDWPEQPMVEEGEVYTVLGLFDAYGPTGIYYERQYELEEIPGEGIYEGTWLYQTERFIRLSDKDESEYSEEVMDKITIKQQV